jgi:hypothetical protein
LMDALDDSTLWYMYILLPTYAILTIGEQKKLRRELSYCVDQKRWIARVMLLLMFQNKRKS